MFKLFRGSYFRVLVVGRENRENLDLAKISRYTVCKNLGVKEGEGVFSKGAYFRELTVIGVN